MTSPSAAAAVSHRGFAAAVLSSTADRHHMSALRRRVFDLLLLVATLLMSACSLPSISTRPITLTRMDTQDTALARALAPLASAHGGKSGIYALQIPRDAFAARGLLAAAAERTIDVQYYIWRDDHTGLLLLESLWLAAERGVRVRLLLDDIGTQGLDDLLAALDAHANIEVRLYNPVTQRKLRLLNYFTSPRRMNRRMHNKSFTVDNRATVVGGRNIGDEYFGAGDGVAFEDLDVVAVGPIVTDVSASFDRYWNSAAAYAVADLLAKRSGDSAAELRERFATTHSDARSAVYLESLAATRLVADLKSGNLAFEWTDVQLVCDDPSKTLGASDRDDLLLPRMLQAVGAPAEQFDLVSPYFVPGKVGTDSLAALAKTIRVRVLTNSLESTDVGAVHAGYARRRKALLSAGVQLYELKGSEAAPDPQRKGSSASLHAKTFAIDRRRVFVGSFNFDPRSAHLNTELGLVFDSPSLARALDATFTNVVPQRAYEVRLHEGRDVIWIEHTHDGERRYDQEPGTTWVQRFGVDFLSILPIESLL